MIAWKDDTVHIGDSKGTAQPNRLYVITKMSEHEFVSQLIKTSSAVYCENIANTVSLATAKKACEARESRFLATMI
jgi:hypothetical protein